MYQKPPPRRRKKPWYWNWPWFVSAFIIIMVIGISSTQPKTSPATTSPLLTTVPLAAAPATQTPFIVGITATPLAVSPTIAATQPQLAPTATIALSPTPLKPIAVFGQGIGTSLNAKGEPQSPTSGYREDAPAYFFLNYQDADPKEMVGIFITTVDGGTKIYDFQKPFGQPVGFVSFLVSAITPGAYQAHFEARGQRVSSLFNFEVFPKPTPVPPTAVPTAVPLPAINSQGLGLTRGEWEAIYGQPSPQYIHSNEQAAYRGNDFLASFYNDKVFGVSIQQFDKNPIDLTIAKTVAQHYMPTDAVFIKTYKAPITGDTTYLYQSKSIITRFPSGNFPWTIPNTQGQIIVIFLLDPNNSNKVLDIDVVLGSEEDLDQ